MPRKADSVMGPGPRQQGRLPLINHTHAPRKTLILYMAIFQERQYVTTKVKPRSRAADAIVNTSDDMMTCRGVWRRAGGGLVMGDAWQPEDIRSLLTWMPHW